MTERAPSSPARRYPWELLPHEIEPGRSVPAHWDKALFETWEERKARRAREKAEASNA